MFLRQESVASYEDVDLLINEISNVSRRSSMKLLELVGNFLHESRMVKSDVDKLQVSRRYLSIIFLRNRKTSIQFNL